MTTQIKKVKDDLGPKFAKMMDPRNLSGALARGAYPLYQKFQLQRLETQNRSEDKTWKALNSTYREAKKKRFQSYPGAGNKMLIATGTLAGAFIGPGPHPFSGTEKHRLMITPFSMTIYVEQSGTNAAGKPFQYASHVNQERPFMKFSAGHIQEMKRAIQKAMVQG